MYKKNLRLSITTRIYCYDKNLIGDFKSARWLCIKLPLWAETLTLWAETSTYWAET